MKKTGSIILSVLLIAGIALTTFGADGQRDKKKHKTDQDGQQKVASNVPMLIDAKRNELTGNDEKAEEQFRQYIDKYPDDAVAYFELARILENKKQNHEAVELAGKAVKLAPGNTWYKLFYAEVLQLDEKYKEAIGVYEEITILHPENLDYLYQLAALYLMVEKYPEAIRVYDRIEAQAGISEEISIQKEKIYLLLNQPAKAQQELEALVAAYPDEVRYLSILAEFYINSKMPEKGLETYKKILEADPGDPYVHMSMADYYRKTGNKQKAYEELQLGFANPNLDIDSKVNILLSFYDISKLPEDSKTMVLELAKTLVAVHPNDPKAHSIYGDLLVEDKKNEEARNEFLKVITLDSSKFLVWQEVLRLDVMLEKFDHLAEYGKRAIELFPDQPVLYLFSGLGSYQQKNYTEALKSFRSGAKLVVNNDELEAEFYMYLGDTYHSLKDTTESDKAYQKSLQIKGDNAYVLNNYAYYLTLRNKELEKAESMAKKAVTLDPENASFQDTYGWVLYKLGRYSDAKIWVGKALNDKDGVSAEVMEHYGDILFKLGDPVQALEYWQKAKTKGPGSAILDKKITEKQLYE
ncbi:MAG: tetratricopeptide repeat protein [Bacteroidetes bacterium]|nr:tetratricopeptide repeat protein [Bacteroidota bacterium]